jgi:N-acetylmuramoyl-L-alanine amidase
MPVLSHPSPNFGPRRDGLTPSLIVLHYTAMDSAAAALERLCDPEAEVSAHYLIGTDGTLWQMVDETMRAWHAGAGEWGGQGDINSRSIGIELDNRGTHPFSAPQMAVLERILPWIMMRWGIAPEGVIAHSDMAPGRKCDPGPRFDWARLARQGMARPAGEDHPSVVDPEQFRRLAQQAGYTAPVSDADLLAAIRLRFRPWAKGPLTGDDLATLAPPVTRPGLA